MVAVGQVDIIDCDRSMACFRVNDRITLDVDQREFTVIAIRGHELIVRLDECEVPLVVFERQPVIITLLDRSDLTAVNVCPFREHATDYGLDYS